MTGVDVDAVVAVVEATIRDLDPQHANPALWARRITEAIYGHDNRGEKANGVIHIHIDSQPDRFAAGLAAGFAEGVRRGRR